MSGRARLGHLGLQNQVGLFSFFYMAMGQGVKAVNRLLPKTGFAIQQPHSNQSGQSMQKSYRTPKPLRAALLAAMFLPSVASAGFVNGDFQTGTFAGWSLDTDGNGPPTPQSPDFQVIDQLGDKLAELDADYFSTPGNTGSTPLDQVDYSNTLSQALPTTVSPGQSLLLSFDWEFGGQETGTPDEVAQIGLGQGGNFFDAEHNMGFLITATTYSSGHFSAILSPFYNNDGTFTMDFQLNAGNNGYGSYLRINNVQIEAVPEPATLLLLAPSLAYLARRRKPNRTCGTLS